SCFGPHRVLHSFPTRRSSDLELALRGRLPTMCSYREFVESGSLMAYAVNMGDFIGRAAVYVDRILKGAKPADLPVEQPTKFELRSEEHTSELQSRFDLVCRLL